MLARAGAGGVAYTAAKHRSQTRRQQHADRDRPTEPADAIEQIKELSELREQGILTEEEFTAEKKKLLGI